MDKIFRKILNETGFSNTRYMANANSQKHRMNNEWYFGLLSTNIFSRKEIILSLLSISTGYLPNSPYSIYHIIRNKYLDVQNHFTKFQAYFY
jgi:hypothetical protein